MFQLRDKVRIKNEGPAIYTIEEIRPTDTGIKYWIQFGTDFATRQWRNESELEVLTSGMTRRPSPVGRGKEQQKRISYGTSSGRKKIKKRNPKRGRKTG